MTNRSDPYEAAIKELLKEPCLCVDCVACGGTGKIWVYDPSSGLDEPETCAECHGPGITETCQRCLDIEELEVDQKIAEELRHD